MRLTSLESIMVIGTLKNIIGLFCRFVGKLSSVGRLSRFCSQEVHAFRRQFLGQPCIAQELSDRFLALGVHYNAFQELRHDRDSVSTRGKRQGKRI